MQITAPEVPTGITVPDVAPLREDLRNAHAARTSLVNAVDAAEALVAKAQEERDQAHKVLAEFNIRQSTRVRELEDRLRNGTSANGALHDDIELPRSRAIEQAEASEQVLSKFQTELREARSRLLEHDGVIRAAAGKVALALFTAQAAELCSIEQKAARLRAELKSADAYFTSDLRQQLSTSVATLLSMPPYSIEDPAGWTARQSLAEGRTKRWKELMTHLCEGDVEAELE